VRFLPGAALSIAWSVENYSSSQGSESMSRNLSQSTAWIFAGFGTLFLFGLLLIWVMNIPGAHERDGYIFDSDARITSDAYEIRADDPLPESSGVKKDDRTKTIRSDDFLDSEGEGEDLDPDLRSDKWQEAGAIKLAAKSLAPSKKKIRSSLDI